MPSDTHECLIVPLIDGLNRAIQSMLLDRGDHSIMVGVHGNIPVKGQDISSIPDVCVRVSSWGSVKLREYIFVEVALSQQDSQATRKLEAYVKSCPHTLAVIKVVINECCWSSPADSSHIAQSHIDSPVLEGDEWKPADKPREMNTFRVIRDGYVWADITGVELTMWMREGPAPINMNIIEPGHPSTAYATGVCQSFMGPLGR